MELDRSYQTVCTLFLTQPPRHLPICMQPWKQPFLPCSGHRQNAQPAPRGHSVLLVGGAMLLLW